MKITYQQERQGSLLFLESLPSFVQKELEDVFGKDFNEEKLKQEKTEGNEDIFEGFFDILPKELIVKKIEEGKKQNQTILETLHAIMNILETRKNTWEIEGDEEQQEKALETIKTLSSARFDHSLFLGRGNAGHVFMAPEAKGYCIKYIHNQSNQFFNLDEEFTLLGQINVIAKDFKALHIPQAHCLAKNTDGTKNFFTMQKIEGLTLQQLIDFPSKRETDYPTFTTEGIIEILEDTQLLKKLLNDIKKLHSAGIIHRDIHPRNIMINPEGKVFLIDFGNAVIPVNVSTHVTYENIENVKELDITTFSNSFKATADALRKQLTN